MEPGPPEAAGADATAEVLVVYALPQKSHVFRVRVVPGTAVGAAIEASGLFQELPHLRTQPLRVGIFGRACTLEDPVRPGDRIEIYRPLEADPKDARRRRAAAQGR